MAIRSATTGALLVATILSLGVVRPMYVLVKNLEQRLFSRQDAPSPQAKASTRATTSGTGTAVDRSTQRKSFAIATPALRCMQIHRFQKRSEHPNHTLSRSESDAFEAFAQMPWRVHGFNQLFQWVLRCQRNGMSLSLAEDWPA